MNLHARILTLTTSLLLLVALSFSPARAQATAPHLSPNTNPDVPVNLHTWTQNVMIEVMAAMSCQLSGIDPTNTSAQCLGVDQATGKISFVPSTSSGQGGGAIGIMGHLITQLYQPPLHTSDYFKDLARNFGFVKPAYAQGIGYLGLKPLMNLWQVFRNVVYLFFVIAFILIGLAIMFRVKIDPRTVMTIGNQIPQIIAGIIIVTFSYAIAGFLIDMMYVSIYLLVALASQASPSIAVDVQNIVQSTNPIVAANIISAGGGKTGGMFNIIQPPAAAISDFFRPFGEHPIGRTLGAISLGFLGKIFGAELPKLLLTIASFIPGGGILQQLLGNVFQAVVGNTLGSIIGIFIGSTVGIAAAPYIMSLLGWLIAFLVLTIALLWALFRLWFQLIGAYVSILIDVVLAPFVIVLGVFPGSPLGFSAWIRDLLANLSAFPVTIGMFLLGRIFMESFGAIQIGTEFVPPLIANPSSSNGLGSLIGIGIIIMTSQVVAITREIFKSPTLKYTAAIGQAVSPGVSAPGRLLGAASSVAFLPQTKVTKEGGIPYIAYPTGPLYMLARFFGLAR